MEKHLDISPINEWGINYTERPLIIAGPCSAESEEQVIDTAQQLASQGIKIFRAGIWKPRTRPGLFEGVGTKGLKWLQTVKKETGMLTSTEVANIKHVFEALKYGVDILWIGARTSANPFAMQEIADALKGVDIPILVKNPVNPDLDLWIGALERINKAGIKKIGAIHRGFSSYEKSVYRNIPQWQIPIELRRQFRDLPIINDPSHIAGKSELILEVAQKAMDLNHDGLIIESHRDPSKAISDARQQVTPTELATLLGKLILRRKAFDDTTIQDSLKDLRAQIDVYDNQLLDILDRRMKIADEIGKFKKENGITILQTHRWDEIIKKSIELGSGKGLSSDFIIKVFMAIHQESINHQMKIMNEEK